LHKNFSKCISVNSDFSYVKVIKLEKFFGIDDIVVTFCRFACNLPLKIDIYACQHPRHWRYCI